MTAPVVLLCLVLLLLMLMQIRVGCKAAYDEGGVRVWVRLGRFDIQVLPMKKKEPKPKKEKKPKKAKKKKGPAQPVPLTEKVGGALGYAQALLPVVLDAVKYFGKKLSMDTLHLHLVAGAPDPADAASVYGKANAALGALWQPLTRAFDVQDGYARVDLDFERTEMTLTARAALSLKLGQVLWLGVYFGTRALVGFIKERQRQKQEKKLRKAV